MDQRSNSSLSLFLMELIIAILFFSLAAAVCVRLFVSAHIMAENTEDLNNATIWSQNLAEAFTGTDGDLRRLDELFPGAYIASDAGDGSEGTMILFFDRDWEQMTEAPSGAAYEVILKITKRDASEVYADANSYGTAIEGKARIGQIAALNTSAETSVVSDIPTDDKTIILANTVDVYLGKEGD